MFTHLITLAKTLGLLPLIGVIVGWGLHELSDIIRLRREDKRAAGKVLAELLNLRRSIRAIPLAIDELRKVTKIPPESEHALHSFYAPIMAQATEGLSERYNAAIDLLAGPFPLLAYELRSKDRLRPFSGELRE